MDRARTLAGGLALAGALLTAGVGHGLSIMRCDATGRVSLSACPKDVAEQVRVDTDDAGCCSYIELQAPWTASSLTRVAPESPVQQVLAVAYTWAARPMAPRVSPEATTKPVDARCGWPSTVVLRT